MTSKWDVLEKFIGGSRIDILYLETTMGGTFGGYAQPIYAIDRTRNDPTAGLYTNVPTLDFKEEWTEEELLYQLFEYEGKVLAWLIKEHYKKAKALNIEV